ncbi:hypothetical protein [Sphingobacterium corticibacterium]|uniref:Response receiver domain-containing protein n=1 Tax=Sphingobacterium corticibacterium TaxID=2484746 RepID=A0A4V2DCP4_9SPHI|nr:hypothetical protein [Sphingobacterium corticibacterium]RZF62198.1 hypothetical protein EWE74_05165 [Sphingobacterium corticibacterium]
MLEKQNKIIIVDNVSEQLEILGKSFFENGLGCRTFKYDISYDEPLEKVRIAFFDINLTEKTVDANYESDAQILANNTPVFNDLANAINQYISKNNGPYVLIFWTANSRIVEAFKLYMRDPARGFGETASPILIDCIDKTAFVDGNDEQENLSDRVLALLNSNEKIKFLFDLEENAKNAGESTLDRIYDILPKNDEWGKSEQLFEDLDKVLSKIAASTLGFQHAKENSKKALYEGLLPIVNYEFLNSESNVNWTEIVSQLNQANRYNDIASPDINIQHKVNTLYHIEDFENHSKDTRGCVIEIDKSNKELITSFGISNYDVWFNDLVPIDDKATRKTIRSNSKMIALEFSAACDYSNKKNRINKYILGVTTDYFDLDTFLNKTRKSESSYHLGMCCFRHHETNHNIWLNLNYVFGTFETDKRFGNPLFIFKKEIMDMLGNKYASHISRIGITNL